MGKGGYIVVYIGWNETSCISRRDAERKILEIRNELDEENMKQIQFSSFKDATFSVEPRWGYREFLHVYDDSGSYYKQDNCEAFPLYAMEIGGVGAMDNTNLWQDFREGFILETVQFLKTVHLVLVNHGLDLYVKAAVELLG
ncbi:MAG TPA: hypothetical protein VKM55_04920 [Candidatus Lokiarchaeia archaeon]|nr:hypothetical protein [Candidatus Lokiarchaeia archaeon]